MQSVHPARSRLPPALVGVARAAAAWLRPPPAPEGPTRLTERRIIILPTTTGIWFALLILLLLIASINFTVSLGFALCFVLAALGLVTVWSTYRNLAGLLVAVHDARPVFAGETAEFPVALTNPSRSARFAVRIACGAGEPQVILDVDPRTSARGTLELRTSRRGWVEIEPVRFSTIYPLGLLHAWSRLRLRARCLVYPVPAAAVPMPTASGSADTAGSEAHIEGDDFGGLRPYHPGDGLRRIAWKALAAGQGTFTKQFVSTVAGTVALDWANAPGKDTEARLSGLARWALDAEAAGMSYSLRLPDVELASGQGPAHLHRVLAALALFEARP